jgi:hypothetical protein
MRTTSTDTRVLLHRRPTWIRPRHGAIKSRRTSRGKLPTTLNEHTREGCNAYLKISKKNARELEEWISSIESSLENALDKLKKLEG